MAGKLKDQSTSPGIGDNSGRTEESDRVQMISIVAQVEKANEKVDASKVVFDAAKKARNTIFKLAGMAGFQRQEIKARMKEMQESASVVADRMSREAKHRKWLGILTDEQIQMFAEDKTPAEIMDEAHHIGEGFKAGLRGLEAKPPTDVPERFVQAWLGGYHNGTETSKAAMMAMAPKPLGERVKAATAAEKVKAVAEKAAADFKADNPQTAELPGPEDVDAAAKRLKASQFMEGAPKSQTVNLAK